MSPATARVATAPGKIMLAGEYAVLVGGDAVLIAVDRRVRARLEAAPRAEPSPLLDAVARILAEEVSAEAAAAATRVTADSDALRAADGTKLGLGSSAAVAVAATAAALADADLATVHRLAHRAHRRAQAERGAAGSGADIAASTYGGAVAVRRVEGASPDEPLEVRPLTLPPALVLVPVWTGAAADTAPLVARVALLGDSDPRAYERTTSAIADAAAALITACERADASAALAALDAAGRAVAALAEAAGVALVSPAHQAAAALAEAAGGVCKPTGAGAGDVALAAFPDPTTAAHFHTAAAAAALLPLDLHLDPTGVTLE